MDAIVHFFTYCAFISDANLILFFVLQVDGIDESIRKDFSQNGFLVNLNCYSAGCSPQSEGGRLQLTCRNRER